MQCTLEVVQRDARRLTEQYVSEPAPGYVQWGAIEGVMEGA